jgi:hypothetical protein
MESLVLGIASHFACLSCLPILCSYFTLRLTLTISIDLAEKKLHLSGQDCK